MLIIKMSTNGSDITGILTKIKIVQKKDKTKRIKAVWIERTYLFFIFCFTLIISKIYRVLLYFLFLTCTGKVKTINTIFTSSFTRDLNKKCWKVTHQNRFYKLPSRGQIEQFITASILSVRCLYSISEHITDQIINQLMNDILQEEFPILLHPSYFPHLQASKPYTSYKDTFFVNKAPVW